MIDIHNHALFNVDDGPKHIEESVLMIEQAIKIGITDLILTPHYNRTYYAENVLPQFKELLKRVEDKPIRLYLGREVKHYFREKVARFFMGSSKYILVEFSTTTKTDIEEVCYNLKAQKINPIVAHVERYDYLKKEDYVAIKQVALLQVNVDSIIGSTPFKKDVKIAKYLLKHKLADIIASDAHDTSQRGNHMDKACAFVKKKYGAEYANLLCIENPKKIIDTMK